MITLSDKGSRGQRQDESGPEVKELLETIGGRVLFTEILPDEFDLIKAKLREYSDKVELIVTTGGTGLSPRDVTPEATRAVIEREVPGLAELMRMEGLKKTRRAMLTRSVAGTRGRTLIINLPGSLKAVRENLGAILDLLPHAIEKLTGNEVDCAR